MVVPAISHIRRRSKPVGRLSTSKKVIRSPILLEWTDTLIKAGFVDKPSPLYMVPKTQLDATLTAEQIYLHYAPIIQSVFDHLGLEAKDRLALVVMNGGIHCSRNLEDALGRMLADQGVEAYSIIPALELVPYAFPPGDMLIVEVTSNEAHCMAYAFGHSLEYTYQATGKVTVNGNDLSSFQALKAAWLQEHSPNSLIMSIIKCIVACPLEIRKNVVQNLVFVGFIPDSDFGRQVALKVQACIQATEVSDENDPASSTTTDQQTVFAVVPVEKKALQPLVGSVSVLHVKCCRPDLLSWLGACVWANHWHAQDPESEHFQWKGL